MYHPFLETDPIFTWLHNRIKTKVEWDMLFIYAEITVPALDFLKMQFCNLLFFTWWVMWWQASPDLGTARLTLLHLFLYFLNNYLKVAKILWKESKQQRVNSPWLTMWLSWSLGDESPGDFERTQPLLILLLPIHMVSLLAGAAQVFA